MNIKESAADLGLEVSEFIELVGLFLKISRTDMMKLQSAIERGDKPQATEASHAIRGSSLNLGFMRIYALATELEDKARMNDFDRAANVIREIRQEIDLISESIEAQPAS